MSSDRDRLLWSNLTDWDLYCSQTIQDCSGGEEDRNQTIPRQSLFLYYCLNCHESKECGMWWWWWWYMQGTSLFFYDFHCKKILGLFWPCRQCKYWLVVTVAKEEEDSCSTWAVKTVIAVPSFSLNNSNCQFTLKSFPHKTIKIIIK